ncbi:hypothetical protein GOBAR_AA09827 [Gossypium barbadense]|uniref:Uncharacterized protein n=1 Tax=Gossypium barbadense TaxID=3634 RepID=A0A2P5Y5G3_GOSBA|nr:hypothetical protein GOBAR_AA09827 [Gossypium barbadense]
MPVYLGCVGAHGRVARPCLSLFTSATPVYEARAGENLCLVSTQPKHAFVLGCVCVAGIIYLKSAELGMTYLDYTKWKNAKYRKRNFFIQFGSDNVRICIDLHL